MGCWMVARGVLEVKPEADFKLIKDYISFSKKFNPYQNVDECFANPWFFDENNNLQSDIGKFGEPSVWYKEIKMFFEERGYSLIGDTDFIGEGETRDFWELCDKQHKLYMKWKERCKDLEIAS